MPMKIILRADVENLGRLGDIVNVKPGYGRNYLIPQGMAMLATKSNLKVFELERKSLQSKMDAIREAAMSEGERINATTLTIEVRVGEGDKLYGSVTTNNIADALAEQGIEIDRRKIDLDQPIRALGEYAVVVRLHPDVHSELKVIVKAHGVIEEEAPAEAAAEDQVEDIEQPVEPESGQPEAEA